ncbi:MAG: IS630 family transposase [Acidobacteria bacterium]|nr:IS630 family transposase [Acidobacteriota bacterium]
MANARKLGQEKKARRLGAILALDQGIRIEEVAKLSGVTVETVAEWVKRFLVGGIRGLMAKKAPGRPGKLTPKQKAEVKAMVVAGPKAAGFEGGCWRTPMIQDWIKRRFGVMYNVHYLSELLRNLGLSYQKAKFESDHLNDIARHKWKTQTFPALVAEAKANGAWLLFGDEASFPQWGTLSYTWAERGHQPVVKTSGKRKGYKVFGVIDYFSGRFFGRGQEGKFNSESYQAFLTQVMAQTGERFVILIQDGAKYHTSAAMNVFFAQHQDRLRVEPLPTYSPDYNPIEKLWKRIKETETHLHHFPTFESLVTKVEQAIARFQNRQEEILALCGLKVQKR